MRALFQTRFPRFYRKRSEDRDVSARATHLKAAMENVFMTTTERKRMSTKTTFKRIALVAVAALGLGVLSVAPSSAAINATDETLTLSASSASVAVGETASVTITSSFVGSAASPTDSRTVLVTGSGAGSSAATYAYAYLYASNTDSANVATNLSQYFSVASGTKTLIKASDGDSFTASSAATFTKGTFTLYIPAVANVGTWTYTVVSQDVAKTTIYKTATFTLTVTAGNTTPVAANSGVQITDTSRTSFVTALTGSDSAIVAAAGTVGATGTKSANIVWSQLNSDSSATTTGGFGVGESVIATITSGPGSLTISGAACSTNLTVTAASNQYVTVCSDGKPGVTTVTLRTSSMNPWVSKTVTFYSTTVDSFALATNQTNAAGTLPLNTGTVAAPTTFTGGLRVTAKDAGASVIQSNAPIYVFSSDTKIVTNYGACSASSVTTGKSYYACDLGLADSGTVTLTVGDSTTIAKSVKTATLSVTVSGNAFTPTVALDKTSYTPGEKMVLTMTAKDSRGTVVADALNSTTGTGYTGVYWQGASPSFSKSSAAEAAGGSFAAMATYVDGTGSDVPTFLAGTDTAIAYAPTTAGTYTLMGKVGPATTATQLLTFTVVDATKDAADAATDAALEATDAAYAAQDAAQLAAESADAATAAAEAATAAAEAATAAVEDLATKVAGLFADLQKQITTLANVVAKIAKKVKA